MSGGDGDDVLSGGAGADSAAGGAGADSIDGGAGDDVLSGNDGADTIRGGDGADSIDGGTDDDTIHGDAGDDSVKGGEGDDYIEGGSGDDLIQGDGVAAQSDAVVVGQQGGVYAIDGADGMQIDVEYLQSNAGHDNSYGYYLLDANGEPMTGQVIWANVKQGDQTTLNLSAAQLAGAAAIGFFIIPDGADANPALTDGTDVTFQLSGGKWTAFADGDPLSGAGNPAYFTDPLLNPDGYDHEGDSAEPGNSNWEDLANGGDQDFNDIGLNVQVSQLTLKSYNDTVFGGEGRDTIYGNQGDDVLHGGDGNDTIEGGDGDDLIYGDAGNDLE